MRVKVTKENVVITENTKINEGEYRVNKCFFQLPECFDGLTVTAAFDNIPVPLFGAECYIPSLKKGTSTLGVYAYKETDDGLQLMYSPKPTRFYVDDGSYNDDIGVEETPEISQFEKYCEEISSLAIPRSNIINQFDIEEEMSEHYIFSAKAIGEMAEIFAAEIQNDRDSIDVLSKEYEDFSRQVDERILEVENREIVHECIKGNKTERNTVVLSDVSPVKHAVNISLSSSKGQELSDMEVTARGKNLFGFEGRVVKDFGDTSNTGVRQFSGDGIYVGITGNNYYRPGKVGYVCDTSNNEITVDCMMEWYGVGIDVPVKSGDVYSVSMTSDTTKSRMVISFYTAQGDCLSYVQGTGFKLTVPDNAAWMVCILTSSQVANGISFKNVQIEKGNEATDFCKYVHPKKLKSNSQGIVLGAESIYPVTIIEAASEDIDISVQYNRDVNVAFNELRDAIVKLGGTV